MFERNGLRRGEFSIEKLLWGDSVKSGPNDSSKWSYRVREVAWSSDSSILSIWVEKDDVDIGLSLMRAEYLPR